MLKRSLIVGTSMLALGVAAPAYAFQGPTQLPNLPIFEESGALVDSTGYVVETLTVDIQNVRTNLIDNAFTGLGDQNSQGAVNVQQNNGNNNVLNAGTGIVTGVGGTIETGEHTNAVATGASVGAGALYFGEGFLSGPSIGSVGIGLGSPSEEANATVNNNAVVFGKYPGLAIVDDSTGEEREVVYEFDTATDQYILVFADDRTPLGLGEIEDVVFATKTPDRENLLTGTEVPGAGPTDPSTFENSAFAGFDGVVNVQQNNGDANTLGQAQAVFANQGRQVGQQAQLGGVNNQVWDGGRIRNGAGTTGGTSYNPFDNGSQFDTSSDIEDGDAETFAEVNDYFSGTGQDISSLTSDFGTSLLPGYALVDLNTYFANTIDNGAFDGISGSFQVQQNNGNVNAMGQSTQILANNLGSAVSLPSSPEGNGIAGGSTASVIAASGVVANTSVFDGDLSVQDDINSLPGLLIPQPAQNNPVTNPLAEFFFGGPEVSNPGIGADTDQPNDLELALASAFSLGTDYRLPNLQTRKDNLIENAFNGGAGGLVNVQQNNGHGNSIGQSTQVALRLGVEDESQLLSAAYVYGVVTNNLVFEFGVDRQNDINGAFNDFAGAVQVQQNNGHTNSMNQVIGINGGYSSESPVFGEKGGTNDALLSGIVARNMVIALSDDGYENTITDSFNGLGSGFTGIANVQQNNGSNNVMNSAVSISVTGVGQFLNN